LAAAADRVVMVLAPENLAQAVDLDPATALDLEGRVAAATVRAEVLAPEAAGRDSVDMEVGAAAVEDTDLAGTRRATTSMAEMDRAAREWAADPERDRAHGM